MTNHIPAIRCMDRVGSKSNQFRDDVTFNVQIEGGEIASNISRAEAANLVHAWRCSGGGGLTYIYLSGSTLANRPRLKLAVQRPRVKSLSVSDKERAELTAKLLAEGILTYDPG